MYLVLSLLLVIGLLVLVPATSYKFPILPIDFADLSQMGCLLALIHQRHFLQAFHQAFPQEEGLLPVYQEILLCWLLFQVGSAFARPDSPMCVCAAYPRHKHADP